LRKPVTVTDPRLGGKGVSHQRKSGEGRELKGRAIGSQGHASMEGNCPGRGDSATKVVGETGARREARIVEESKKTTCRDVTSLGNSFSNIRAAERKIHEGVDYQQVKARGGANDMEILVEQKGASEKIDRRRTIEAGRGGFDG